MEEKGNKISDIIETDNLVISDENAIKESSQPETSLSVPSDDNNIIKQIILANKDKYFKIPTEIKKVIIADAAEQMADMNRRDIITYLVDKYAISKPTATSYMSSAEQLYLDSTTLVDKDRLIKKQFLAVEKKIEDIEQNSRVDETKKADIIFKGMRLQADVTGIIKNSQLNVEIVSANIDSISMLDGE
jgi:hypothetical protein